MGATAPAGGLAEMGAVQEFFAMGGHGLYVWLSYGISFLVISVLIWRLRASRREFVRQARARSQRMDVSGTPDVAKVGVAKVNDA